MRRIGLGHALADQRFQRFEHVAVILSNLGDAWGIVAPPGCQRIDRLNQLADALILGRHHGDNRDADGGLQDVSFDVDLLALGDVDHVDADDDGGRQGQ